MKTFKTWSNEVINEAKEISSDDAFRTWAENLLQNAFGEDYDPDIANKTISDLLGKYDRYGEMVGALKSGLAD